MLCSLVPFKVPLEVIGQAHQIFKKALYKYGEDASCYIPPKMLEEAVNEKLQVRMNTLNIVLIYQYLS